MASSWEAPEWEVPVNAELKCTSFKPFKFVGPVLLPHCGSSKRTNPYMRGFWAATIVFNMAFMGWFAFAPLMVWVRKDIGICDNAAEVALDLENTDCICQNDCRRTLVDAGIASVSFDVFMRFLMGAIIERAGPRNTDVLLLCYGAIVVACSAAVTSGEGLIVIRFFVSAMGATFVVNQVWNSILFDHSVVGIANATAGGWGNLGAGMVQVIMPAFYRLFHNHFGVSLSTSWRLCMLVPALVYVVLAVWVFFGSQDTPKGKFDVRMMGKQEKAGFKTYWECVKDYRVVLMFFQYGACFGTELVMHNLLHSYFHDTFHMDAVSAGMLAFCFGGCNIYARPLGGLLSDWASSRMGMRGRLWVHFFSLLGQGATLFGFASVTPAQGWGFALFWLILFATFVNMAEGTSYGIVPFMIPEHLAVVSAIVGAGGTLGAVIVSSTLYRFASDDVTAMKWNALYVVVSSFTVFAMRWENLGSMFSSGTCKPAASIPASTPGAALPGEPEKLPYKQEGSTGPSISEVVVPDAAVPPDAPSSI